MVRWMRWHCPPDTGFEIPVSGCLMPSTLPLGHGGSPQYWVVIARNVGSIATWVAMTFLSNTSCHSGLIQDFQGFSSRAKPKGCICLFTSKQILPFGFLALYGPMFIQWCRVHCMNERVADHRDLVCVGEWPLILHWTNTGCLIRTVETF